MQTSRRIMVNFLAGVRDSGMLPPPARAGKRLFMERH
jgi:hypothetical protein